MRRVEFAGKEWAIPDWAQFITQDYDGGAIIVWENRPTFTKRGHFTHDLSNPKNLLNPGESKCIGHVEVLPLIAQIF